MQPEPPAGLFSHENCDDRLWKELYFLSLCLDKLCLSQIQSRSLPKLVKWTVHSIVQSIFPHDFGILIRQTRAHR